MLHGEPNTGKTKTVLGHGCEPVVSHVAGIILGMGGQRAQGPRGLYWCQSWGTESGLSSVPCQASCCSLFSLLFPSKTVILQSWHSTWHKWLLFPHLLRPVKKYCPRCWGLLEMYFGRASFSWFDFLFSLFPVLMFLNSETLQKWLVNFLCCARREFILAFHFY